MWQLPHSLITSVWKDGLSCTWIACALWQSVQPGAASMPSCRNLPCMPLPYASRSGLWQLPQVSGMRARETLLRGSDFGWMLWVPWQSVHSGADIAAADLSALPWILSSNLPPTLPLGSLPLAMTASLPWHFSQVATRFR